MRVDIERQELRRAGHVGQVSRVTLGELGGGDVLGQIDGDLSGRANGPWSSAVFCVVGPAMRYEINYQRVRPTIAWFLSVDPGLWFGEGRRRQGLRFAATSVDAAPRRKTS